MSIQVVNDEGAPLGSVEVGAILPDGTSYEGVTDGEGRLTIPEVVFEGGRLSVSTWKLGYLVAGKLGLGLDDAPDIDVTMSEIPTTEHISVSGRLGADFVTPPRGGYPEGEGPPDRHGLEGTETVTITTDVGGVYEGQGEPQYWHTGFGDRLTGYTYFLRVPVAEPFRLVALAVDHSETAPMLTHFVSTVHAGSSENVTVDLYFRDEEPLPTVHSVSGSMAIPELGAVGSFEARAFSLDAPSLLLGRHVTNELDVDEGVASYRVDYAQPDYVTDVGIHATYGVGFRGLFIRQGSGRRDGRVSPPGRNQQVRLWLRAKSLRPVSSSAGRRTASTAPLQIRPERHLRPARDA